jgi:hypothetical protein
MGIKNYRLLLAGLFFFAVPWYWQYVPQWSQLRFIGLPVWVLACLIGSALTSTFCVFVLRTPWDLEEADLEETFSSDGVRDDVSFESDRMNILEVNGKQRSGIDPATGIDGIDR